MANLKAVFSHATAWEMDLQSRGDCTVSWSPFTILAQEKAKIERSLPFEAGWTDAIQRKWCLE